MKETTKRFYHEAVSSAVGRIVGGLNSAVDLADLAMGAGLSPFHFHRVFRGMLGETPLELHRRLRLERAAFDLATSDAAVTMIAFDAGFETLESFTRAFQAAYAIAPSQFRARMRLHHARMNFPIELPYFLPALNGIHLGQVGDVTEFVVAEEGMKMDVVVKEQPETRIAAITHIGPRNMVGEAFGRLAGIAGPAGLFGPEATAVAVFVDEPETTPASDLRTSAGVIVGVDVLLPAELAEQRIPAGKYACATHRGHYAGLGDAWDRFLGQWLPNSGYHIADRFSYEIYRVADHSRPNELETELYVAVS